MQPRTLVPLVVALCMVYASGSVLDVMEVDAAQYASMAQDMALGADPLELHFRGADYLDKPPLLFWLSALSFKLFGVHNWSYKLPSILAGLFALYATFRLARLYHGRDTGIRAALMLGSSLAMVLMMNDVRCDTLLMAAVITAIWQGAEYLERPRWSVLLGAAIAVAMGMLAKGPMGLMAPVLALGGHVAIKGRWSVLRDARLLVLLPIIGLLLLPMCIGLYRQFGLQGLRFFFWEQSFGRLTGENVWKDDSGPFFFTHEVLWQVLPWTLFVLVGLWMELRDLFGRARTARPEWIALSGAVLVFVALSCSHFKLPHYLYVVHPLFCIIGAKALPRMQSPGWERSQFLLMVLLVCGGGLLLWSFPDIRGAVLLIPAIVLFIRSVLRSSGPERLMEASFLPMVLLALMVNLAFYPNLLSYQANAQAGRWVHTHAVRKERFIAVGLGGTALDHYAGWSVEHEVNAWAIRDRIHRGLVIYTDSTGCADLQVLGFSPDTVARYEDYKVQLLSPRFLDPSTRSAVLEKRYLLRF